MISGVLFSSNTTEWATPQDFFNKLNQEFHFTLDVCATPENAKCSRYYTKKDNGLTASWKNEVCWLNPPYGRKIIDAWIKKAYESAIEGAVVVCLLPARTDTAWWHDYCVLGEIRFIRGRLKFDDGKTGAPFPSAIVIFRKDVDVSSTTC